ncbi:MAG: tetratricopeptide repeat protein, partial [Magnetococcales bacterium]|nr:tetratricopeptide repeat protein [Magnetococcales bacterium]
PDTAACVAQFADMNFSQGEFHAAGANYQQVVEILKGTVQIDLPALLKAQTDLAKTYHRLGRREEAKRLIARVIKLGRLKPEENAQLLSEARLTALREGMQRVLSPNLRQALTLVTLEGFSYEAAAEVADVPVNTLKTRVFRARKQLRDAMVEQGHL